MKDIPVKEVRTILDQSKRILLVAQGDDNTDSVASMLALSAFLTQLGKETIMLTREKPRQTLPFLSGIDEIGVATQQEKRLTVILDTSKKKVEKLSYEASDHKLKIFITSKNEGFSASDVSFEGDDIQADAVITLGIGDLDDLDRLYARHTKLFYDKPIINIDTNPANEYFGEVNVVDIKSSSLAEILSNIFIQINNKFVTKEVATCLLTGIITKTNSFQNILTTPKTFTIAAQLVARGADQHEIIRHLYKTKPFSILKLWGRVLARIKELPEKKLLWSVITKEDFSRTKTSEQDIREVLRELMQTTEHAEVTALLYEKKDGAIGGYLAARKHRSAKELVAPFNGTGDDALATFDLKKRTLGDAEEEFLSTLKRVL
jgi:nanoRNase/pAp phosphatase (c-di-AMP/oligoRNAs hydrolase)